MGASLLSGLDSLYDRGVPDEDRPRLLHARSEFGYTDRLRSALPEEPEAVPADYQRRLSRAASTRRRLRDREAWLACRDRIKVELQLLRGHRFDNREVATSLRVMQRQIERVDRLLS
jgi:hypothetical protein